MAYDQIVKLIVPNLTYWGVLVTLGCLSFKFFTFCWKHEKELRVENFERIKDLLATFRQRNIEPLLKKKFIDSINDSYNVALGVLTEDFYEEKIVDGKPTTKIVEEEEKLQRILQDFNPDFLSEKVKNLQKNTDRMVEGYFSSASGEDKLFGELDKLYEKKAFMSKQYRSVFFSCKAASFSFLFLSIFLFVGILQILIKWPNWLICFWVFLLCQSLIIAIFCTIRSELCRARLIRKWEELQFYDEI